MSQNCYRENALDPWKPPALVHYGNYVRGGGLVRASRISPVGSTTIHYAAFVLIRAKDSERKPPRKKTQTTNKKTTRGGRGNC